MAAAAVISILVFAMAGGLFAVPLARAMERGREAACDPAVRTTLLTPRAVFWGQMRRRLRWWVVAWGTLALLVVALTVISAGRTGQSVWSFLATQTFLALFLTSLVVLVAGTQVLLAPHFRHWPWPAGISVLAAPTCLVLTFLGMWLLPDWARAITRTRTSPGGATMTTSMSLWPLHFLFWTLLIAVAAWWRRRRMGDRWYGIEEG